MGEEKKKGMYGGNSVIDTNIANIGETRTYIQPPGAGIIKEKEPKEGYVKHKKL